LTTVTAEYEYDKDRSVIARAQSVGIGPKQSRAPGAHPPPSRLPVVVIARGDAARCRDRFVAALFDGLLAVTVRHSDCRPETTLAGEPAFDRT
jgi:hypothetical protein